MEEAALAGVVWLLFRLLFPVSGIAVCVGIVTLAVAIFPPKKVRVRGRIFLDGPPPRNPAPIVERIAVGLCAPLPILGLIVIVHSIGWRTPGSPFFLRWPEKVAVVATLVLGLPAILWTTRLRIAAEGLATIALGVVSVLTGMSIGILFVPLTVLMIWTCVRHLRDIAQSRNHILEARRP
jgi:hypothetical protein